jgi:hypothetical protein
MLDQEVYGFGTFSKEAFFALEGLQCGVYTVKKCLPFFPSPAGMSLTKLSLAGNHLIIPRQGDWLGHIPAGDGKVESIFLQCMIWKELYSPVRESVQCTCNIAENRLPAIFLFLS